MPSRFPSLILGCLAALTVTSVLAVEARAEEFTRRRFVLPEGGIEITGEPARPRVLEVNFAPYDFAEPTTLHPHVYFGLTDDITLGITHWRGVCLVECRGQPYNDVGLKLMFELTRSTDFELDLDAGVQAASFDPFQMFVWGGVLGRANLGVLALVFNPRVYVGAYDADSWLDLPLWVYFQPTPGIAPFVGTGLNGAVEGFFDGIRVPLEGGVVFEVTNDIDLGVVASFWNVLGNNGSFDARSFGMLARFRI